MMGRMACGLGGGILLLACGGTVSLREPEPGAGGSAASGSTGVGGSQQVGIVGGAPQTIEPEECTLPLDDLCGGGCPETAADLRVRCADSFSSLTSQPTDCGGTVVSSGGGFGAVSWFFDADGKLAGVIQVNDTALTCVTGGVSFTFHWGNTCAPTGEATDGCLPPGGCSPEPLACDAGEGCPASSEQLLGDVCGKPTTLGVVTVPTSCGGSIVVVSDAEGVVRYCFDSQDRLVGIKSQPEGAGEGTNSGSDCVAAGEASYACADDTE